MKASHASLGVIEFLELLLAPFAPQKHNKEKKCVRRIWTDLDSVVQSRLALRLNEI